MNRREFCTSGITWTAAAASGGLWSIPLKVFAGNDPASATPQFFIQYSIYGGWDASLAMDPWFEDVRPEESDYFLEYRRDELLPFVNGKFVGPCLAPLKNYFQRMSLFNGVFMSRNDGGHESAALYAKTGNGQGHLGLLCAELEGRVLKSPFGILANGPVFTGSNSKMVWDLNGLIADGSIKDTDLILNIPDKNSELSQARSALIQNADQVKVFNTEFAKMSVLKTNGHAIAAAFISGLATSASIQANGAQLDTHSSHKENHKSKLTQVFTDIKNLLDTLQSVSLDGTRSLLDCTTVMITSEFTRTPALNFSQGKDHNPQCNSAIVLSPKLVPGVYGGSRLVTRAMSPYGAPYLAGKPLDRGTYEVVERLENSFILRPDSVVATIAQAMGCNPGSISEGLGQAPIVKTALR